MIRVNRHKPYFDRLHFPRNHTPHGFLTNDSGVEKCVSSSENRAIVHYFRSSNDHVISYAVVGPLVGDDAVSSLRTTTRRAVWIFPVRKRVNGSRLVWTTSRRFRSDRSGERKTCVTLREHAADGKTSLFAFVYFSFCARARAQKTVLRGTPRRQTAGHESDTIPPLGRTCSTAPAEISTVQLCVRVVSRYRNGRDNNSERVWCRIRSLCGCYWYA